MDQAKRTPLSMLQKQAIDALFIQNFGELLNLAGEDRNLTASQPDEIVEWVSRYVDLYPADQSVSFLEWASAIVLPLRQMYALKNLFGKYVYHGIWRMIRGYTDLLDSPDLSVPPIERPLTSIDEIACTVWSWAFEHIAELSDPTITKSPLSRLNQVAYFAARTWVTNKLRDRGYKPNQERETVSLSELTDEFIPPVESAEPDDSAELSKAIDNVIAFQPKPKKRSRKDDLDMTDWGKPVIGAWMLCWYCQGHLMKRVLAVDGYTAALSCSHTRTSDSGIENTLLAA